ncbi:DoxX family membrane protein [Flavobacteriaceae bacterium F08102]|nr:DoxX family membrane protein [Flavobacteriaceae bacterium F08102]
MNSTVKTIMRIVLGLILLVFGLNKFINFMPMEAPEEGTFMYALMATGYMMPLLGFSETAIGIMLLLNKWKGFALAWLVPISVNIVAFHLAFDVSTIAPAALVAVLNGTLIYANWEDFKRLF